MDATWLVGAWPPCSCRRSACQPTPRSLLTRGDVLIEAGCQEIGSGAYTVMPQIAADALGGLDPDRIKLQLGDTTLPETGGTFGSSTTPSVGSAVPGAATKLRVRLLQMAEGRQPLDASHYSEVLQRVGVGPPLGGWRVVAGYRRRVDPQLRRRLRRGACGC